MKAATRKLKSKSGISLAIALVFFLLCAMVGTVVLSAASVSAGNTARERQLYRQTLAMTSAANVLREDIRDMCFTAAYTRSEIVTTTVYPEDDIRTTTVKTEEKFDRGKNQDAPKLENSTLFRIGKNADGSIQDALHLSDVFFGNQEKLDGSVPVEGAETTVTFGAVEEQNIPAVAGTVTVGKDYTLTVVLQCGENTMTMTFPPQTAVQTAVAAPTVSKTNATTTQKTTITTYTTILTWGQPLMKEGGADDAQTP